MRAQLTKQFKSVITTLLYRVGFWDRLRRKLKNQVIILMYHRFSDKHEPFKLQQDIFENQIIYLKKRYNFVSLTHYSQFLNGQRSDLPDNSIILTMDDGYIDNFIYAYPILKKYSIPATIFVTTDFINTRTWLWFNKLKYIIKNTKCTEFEFQFESSKKNFLLDSFANVRNTKLFIFNYCKTIHPNEIGALLEQLSEKLLVQVPGESSSDFEPLTWDQIKEMQRHNIEFGSHTCSHPILSTLKNDEMENEIISSKKELSQKLRSEITSFCYPVGQPEDISEKAIKITQEAGYQCAVTTTHGANHKNSKDIFMLKRLSISTDNEVKLFRILTNV